MTRQNNHGGKDNKDMMFHIMQSITNEMGLLSYYR